MAPGCAAAMQVLVKGSQKAPWKYLDSIEVEELRFGLVPPTLQVASAKFDPAASMLTLAMDVRFVSNSAQAVVSSSRRCFLGCSSHGLLLCMLYCFGSFAPAAAAEGWGCVQQPLLLVSSMVTSGAPLTQQSIACHTSIALIVSRCGSHKKNSYAHLCDEGGKSFGFHSSKVTSTASGWSGPTLWPACVQFSQCSACVAVCLQLLARSKQVGPLQPLTVRMEATHVKLRGRLRLALVLGQEPPGIM
jgi:hypothetical protein